MKNANVYVALSNSFLTQLSCKTFCVNINYFITSLEVLPVLLGNSQFVILATDTFKDEMRPNLNDSALFTKLQQAFINDPTLFSFVQTF